MPTLSAKARPNLITNYTYDLWDNLSQVSMPRSAGAQTRMFVYSGKYLTSAENGTVNYTYTANGKLATKTDAKGQQIVYTYDAYLRLTQIQRYLTPGNEDPCQRTLFYYDTNPFNGSFSQYAYGRPTATQYRSRLRVSLSVHRAVQLHAGRPGDEQAAGRDRRYSYRQPGHISDIR